MSEAFFSCIIMNSSLIVTIVLCAPKESL